MTNTTSPTLSLTPALKTISPKKTEYLDFIVRLSAPEAPQAGAGSRPHVNLALVIDKSGSMAGQPLDQAKQAARHLVSRLEEGDQACIVVYGSTVEVLAEPMSAVAGRSQLLAAIDSIQSSGGTPLRAGWLLAAQALAPYVSVFPISRVLLLSDGQATDGSVPSVIAQEAQELAQSGITTSTYGLGHYFNEDLMTQLAQGGQGQAFYAESAEALIPYFEAEFNMLAATVGKTVQVEWSACVDSQPAKVLRLDTLKATLGTAMPAMIHGADSWVGGRVDLKEFFGATAVAPKVVRISAHVTWETLEGSKQEMRAEVEVPFRQRATPSKDEWVLERIKEVKAARLQWQALEEARRGNWEEADQVLRGLSAASANNTYVSSVAQNLSSMVSERDLSRLTKEVAYSSHTMASRVIDHGEQAHNLSPGRFGLRKARQGQAAPSDMVSKDGKNDMTSQGGLGS